MSERLPTEDDIFRADVLFSYMSNTTTDRTDHLIFKSALDLLTKAFLEKQTVPDHILNGIGNQYNSLCDVFISKRVQYD